ncbi:MAG TPA: SdpA family antimicrobial peptide system protein [Puia sp.]|nr:SdpA family antimicrobial peptide system protein [Puia sp.]
MGKSLRFAFIVIWSFWILFIVFNLITYSDDNPIKIRYRIFDGRFKLFFPEGWAFFTKSPREDFIEVYEMSNSHLQKVRGQRQAELSDWLGLKRDSRAESVEFSYLLSRVKSQDGDSLWTECNFSELENLISHDKVKTYPVSNSTISPFYCGRIFLVKKQVVPWAWSANFEKINLPVQVISLLVECRNIQK